MNLLLASLKSHCTSQKDTWTWKKFWLTLSLVLQKKEYTAHLYKALFITWLRLYSRGVSLSQTNITTPTQSLSHAHLTVTCMLASIHVRFCYIQLTIHVHVFSFPDIAAIQLKMPNLHFLPVNLSNKDHTIVKVRLFLCLYILQVFVKVRLFRCFHLRTSTAELM